MVINKTNYTTISWLTFMESRSKHAHTAANAISIAGFELAANQRARSNFNNAKTLLIDRQFSHEDKTMNYSNKIKDVNICGNAFALFLTDTIFDNVGAVYVFMKREPIAHSSTSEATYKILYVGETIQLQNRIASHQKWDCVKLLGVNCIGFHLDGNEDSRLAKEREIRLANEPPCNKEPLP